MSREENWTFDMCLLGGSQNVDRIRFATQHCKGARETKKKKRKISVWSSRQEAVYIKRAGEIGSLPFYGRATGRDHANGLARLVGVPDPLQPPPPRVALHTTRPHAVTAVSIRVCRAGQDLGARAWSCLG